MDLGSIACTKGFLVNVTKENLTGALSFLDIPSFFDVLSTCLFCLMVNPDLPTKIIILQSFLNAVSLTKGLFISHLQCLIMSVK